MLQIYWVVFIDGSAKASVGTEIAGIHLADVMLEPAKISIGRVIEE